MPLPPTRVSRSTRRAVIVVLLTAAASLLVTLPAATSATQRPFVSVLAIVTDEPPGPYLVQFRPGGYRAAGPTVSLPINPRDEYVEWARSLDGRRVALTLGSDELFFIDLVNGRITGKLDDWDGYELTWTRDGRLVGLEYQRDGLHAARPLVAIAAHEAENRYSYDVVRLDPLTLRETGRLSLGELGDRPTATVSPRGTRLAVFAGDRRPGERRVTFIDVRTLRILADSADVDPYAWTGVWSGESDFFVLRRPEGQPPDVVDFDPRTGAIVARAERLGRTLDYDAVPDGVAVLNAVGTSGVRIDTLTTTGPTRHVSLRLALGIEPWYVRRSGSLPPRAVKAVQLVREDLAARADVPRDAISIDSVEPSYGDECQDAFDETDRRGYRVTAAAHGQFVRYYVVAFPLRGDPAMAQWICRRTQLPDRPSPPETDLLRVRTGMREVTNARMVSLPHGVLGVVAPHAPLITHDASRRQPRYHARPRRPPWSRGEQVPLLDVSEGPSGTIAVTTLSRAGDYVVALLDPRRGRVARLHEPDYVGTSENLAFVADQGLLAAYRPDGELKYRLKGNPSSLDLCERRIYRRLYDSDTGRPQPLVGIFAAATGRFLRAAPLPFDTQILCSRA